MYNTLVTSPNLYRIISTFHPRIIAGDPKKVIYLTTEDNKKNTIWAHTQRVLQLFA